MLLLLLLYYAQQRCERAYDIYYIIVVHRGEMTVALLCRTHTV